MKKIQFVQVYFILIASLSISFADVKLPSIISDNMVIQQNTSVPIWGWADPGEKIKVKGSWQKESESATANNAGKWLVKIKSPEAGGPFEIEIQGENEIILKNVLSGEVWLASGQSNMAYDLKYTENSDLEIADANYPKFRLFHIIRTEAVEPQTDCKGSWQECTPQSVKEFAATAYYFGKKIHKNLSVPVGIISSSKGGSPIESWISEDTLKANKDFQSLYEMWEQKERDYPAIKMKYRDDLEVWQKEKEIVESNGQTIPLEPKKPPLVEDIERRFHRRPSFLFNAMIAPIISYAMKGVIWYQGENNILRPYQYRELFPALIKNWRKLWQQGDFSFYFVQIAPNLENDKPQEFLLMEAQTMTLTEPNTGMVVTTDIGDLNDYHPKNKRDVGERLALWALAKTYGYDNIVYSGPLYKSMKIEGNKIRISFNYASHGLVSKGGELNNFLIAGQDKVFKEAKALVDGKTVVVSSEQIKNPVAVRFAWDIETVPNLFNKDGLPAVPFRTDDWD